MPGRRDGALVADILNGDADAFAVLAHRYRRRVYAIAYAKLLGHADAEDVVQEVLLRAYERLGQLRSPDSFASWVSRIALSCVGDVSRRHARETPMDVQRLLRDEPVARVGQEDYERASDARRLAASALRSLPDSLRLPLVMHDAAEMSYDQIAGSLLIPRSTAEKRVQRARRRVKAYFEASGLSDLVRTLALPTLVMAGPSDAVMSRLLDAAREMPAPCRLQPARYESALFGSTVAGVAVTCLIATGFYLATWADTRAVAAAAGDSTDPVVVVGHPAPSHGADQAGVVARDRARGPIPQDAVLILDESYDDLMPGRLLPGWTEGAYAQPDEIPPGGGSVAAVVNTNIPSAYCQFPLVQGVVTFELWLKPGAGPDVNCALKIGNDLGGWRSADQSVHDTRPADGDAYFVPVIIKNDEDIWFCHTPGHHDRRGGVESFGVYGGEWTHIRMVCDTARNVYDVYLDFRLVRHGIPIEGDLTAGVSYFAISSGRWHRDRDKPSYFDSLRVYVEPFGDEQGGLQGPAG
ncbi:hypothetical protein CMK11_02875 [Candidatus Poribacteria bacterium]|nr:hypothetical protein [Candidatus Poribacteria bacterium]